MDIKIKNIEDITVISLAGNLLGESDSEALIGIISDSIKDKKNRFIFNVKELVYINSTGLSILISSLTKSRNAGGDLLLVEIPKQLDSLLKITKLENIFPKFDTLEEALNNYKA